MEELKEIGYVGGKTTHGDVRQAINANSEVANGNFGELSSAVQDAAKAAQGATETAQAADAAAGEAKQTAEAAKGTAEGAAEAAAEAQRVAGAAEEVADGAAATAEAAQETATGAQSAAETAARDAATAKQDAATAKSDAASAKSTAEGAQSTAETAASNASAALEAAQAAQGTADTAKETAEAAQTAAEGAAQTASAANGTAGAAKTAADKAAEDAATAKSDAATAKSTAETASQAAETAKSTADTAKSTADTAKSTAETAKQTAEGAKASVEGLTGDVTELGQQLEEVSTDATDAADGLRQFMTMGILTQAPFPRATAEASGSFAAVGGDAALADGEIIPWTGWLTLALCYETSDSAAKVRLTGYAGPTLGNRVLISDTAVAASDGPRVVRITGEHDYNPERNGASDACMIGSSYHVNVEVQNPNAGFTMLWAVVYESDPYGNPRRRGGSERERLCACQGVKIQNTFENDTNERTPVVYNERTGWFEMNGLTNISWKDMRAIAEIGASPDTVSSQTKNTSAYYNGIRTNQFTRGFSSQGELVNSTFTDVEVLHLNNSIALPQSGWMSSDCEVIAIIGYFNLGYVQKFNQYNAFGVQTTLESVKLRSLKQSFTLNIKMLSWDSINYLITNAANSEAITITVHADVYAKMTGGTVDNWGSLGTLAEEKGVKLVAYGESGYPFLARVLWHGYKRLENKINAAKSGDVIYIHPDDRRKITAAQKDDWAALVTAGAEKQISFALPAE